MAIIKTYPLKNNYYGPDRLILSDMQPDDNGIVHGTTKSLTLSNLKSFLGANAVLNLTTTGTSGASTYDANTNTLNVPVYDSTTYTLQALDKSSNSVPLKLDASSGTDSTVNFTEGANVTLTKNSATEIIISATGGNAGVSSITNAFGTYISGTANTAATGAVDFGTINLNAVDGTSIATTRFLSKDNTWDVISASGSNTQFQYNNNGAFAGSSMLVLGTDEIVIGDTLTQQGKLRIEGNETVSGNIKIEGTTATRGVILSVQPTVSSNYNVVFPNTGPGGNNKILESDSSGNLAWITTPTGINVVGNPSGTASADLSKITIGSTIYAIPTQGLTSVGLSAPPAFSVTGSPLTSNGSISIGVTGGTAGEFLAYNGQWATPTASYTSWTLQADDNVNRTIVNGATVDIQGGTGITTTTINPTGTLYVVSAALDAATSSTRGGIKIGYTETGKNYPVELSSEQAYVNVPWTDTVYTLPEATATARGGIELFSNTTQTTAANSVTTTASRTYGIQLNAANQAVVNVPWVGGGTGSPAGVANNVQFSDGTSFSADVNFNWDSSSNKLILGKDSTPQFQEGILRLLGDGQGGTAGTIEFQSAQGKSGGAAATVKLQGPVSGVTQEILLPDALPTANTQVLGIDTIVGTKVTTQWETPSTGTTYTAGTGITINSGNVISNTDLGSSQFIYKNFAGSTGGTATASSNNDTLTIAAGTGITTARSGNTITVAATGSGSYDDGFIPLDIYQATSPIGGNDGDFSFIRQTQSYNSSTINRISFFVQSIGVNPEIRFALFDGANVKNGVGTCRVNASSSSLTAGIINEMALTDGEGTTINYTCVPGKNLVLFFAIRNCVIVGSAALSDAGLGHQDESYVSLPSVDDSLSTTKTAIGTDPNNKIAACHFFKT